MSSSLSHVYLLYAHTPEPSHSCFALLRRSSLKLELDGFSEIIINVSYLGDQIKEHIDEIFPKENISSETIEGNFNLNQYRCLMPRKDGYTFMVDDDRCYGCGACIALCPVNVLNLETKLAVVDEKNCTHCRLCIPSCPVFALDIKPEV